MTQRRIDFSELDWETPMPGARFKRHVAGAQVMRLVEFTEELVEPDWCRKGHTGYVIEGRMTIEFEGENVTYNAGDALFLAATEADKHMATVAPGEKVVLFLVEEE